MPTFRSFEAFAKALDASVRDLSSVEKAKITRKMGVKAQAIARAQAAADLGGDPKFSGWRPILGTKLKMDSGATILMPTKSGAGPWTVAEKGRHADGGVGRFQGPAINTRTGATNRTKTGKISRRRVRSGVQWNGTTKGKGTATSAVRQMDVKLPPIAQAGVIRVLRKRFDVT